MQQRTLVIYGNQQVGDEIAKAIVSKEVKRLQEENKRLQEKVNMQEEFHRVDLKNRSKKLQLLHNHKPEPKIKEAFAVCMAMLVLIPEYIAERKKNNHRSAVRSRGSSYSRAGGAA